MKVNWKSVKRGGGSRPPLQRPQHRNLLRGWSRRERQACRYSHSSPESISGRPPLQSRPRLSRCRDSWPSRPPLGSQELSLLRCQGMAEGNRLPALENAPHLKIDGEFFRIPPSPFSQRELHLSHQASLPSGTRGCNRPPVLRTATL